jgi:hypothetical protein
MGRHRRVNGPPPTTRAQQRLLAAVPEPAPPAQAASLSSEVQTVTPLMAARWLERNHPSNRPVAWGRVESFANDMRSGAWKLTHQGICFDAEGYLIDGQHRLQALVNAEATVLMLVSRNLAGTFHDPIDRVGPRSVATIMGMGSGDVAALNTLRMLETGIKVFAPMTLAEAEGVIERHREAWEEVRKFPCRKKLTGPMIAAVMWALPCGPERTLDFMNRMATGEMIGRGNPVFAFRSWRERNRRLDPWDVAHAALNCLRHYLTDVPLASVYTSVAGYRAFCSKRRALKVPNTPDVDMVPTGSWTPIKSDRGED